MMTGPDKHGASRHRNDVVQNFAVKIVLFDQDHGAGVGQVLDVQPGQLLAVGGDLVLAAGVELPRDAVQGGRADAEGGGGDPGEDGEHGVGGGGEEVGDEDAAQAADDGGFVEAVSNSDPPARFFSKFCWFNNNILSLFFKGTFKLKFEPFLRVNPIINFPYYNCVSPIRTI